MVCWCSDNDLKGQIQVEILLYQAKRKEIPSKGVLYAKDNKSEYTERKYFQISFELVYCQLKENTVQMTF